MGVKDAFAALGELIRNSVPDWAVAARKRWLLAFALTVLTNAVVILLYWRHVPGTPRLLRYTEAATSGILAIFVFADAMRLIDPTYRITKDRFGRLVWVSLYMGVFFVIVAIPFFVLNAWHQSVAADLFLFAGAILVGSRLRLAYYLTERKERPVLVSFLLTGGPAFAPSILFAVITDVPRYAFQWAFPLLHTPNPVEYAALYATALMVMQFAATTWQYPMTVRWLAVCERLHPEIDVTAHALLPQPDANLT